jgi:serine/threonine protein kinase
MDWQQIRGLVHEALQLPPEQRNAYLNQACGADTGLRAEIESLLAASAQPALIDIPAIENPDLLVTATVTMKTNLPQSISHYQVVEKIGEGGMGAVYKAVDVRLGRTVALKIVSDKHPDEDGRRKRHFEREARTASALNHPNIVTIYEFNSENGLDFIAMEYVEGQTLNKLLEHGTPLATLLEYARQAATGIAAAHAAGVVHRDLKPSNIMVTSKGAVKVLDFGLARQSAASNPELKTETLTQAGAVMGTAAYMSPEQALSEPVGPPSDIFSFGIVLYEMVCGARPFQAKSVLAMLDQVVRRNPPSPAELNPDAPPALIALIERCLRKAPAERPASMGDVAAVLGDVLGDVVTSMGVPVTPSSSRRRWMIAGASALVALAAGVWLELAPKHSLSNAPAAPSLPYSIEAQKMKAGKAAGMPYLASPTDTFQGGWRFRLHIQPPKPGFVYVVNKGLDDKGAERFWILDHVAADQSVVTRWYNFDENPGTERVWLLWSAQPLGPIEEALRDSADGSVRSPAIASALEQLLDGQKNGQLGIQGELLELKHQ